MIHLAIIVIKWELLDFISFIKSAVGADAVGKNRGMAVGTGYQ